MQLTRDMREKISFLNLYYSYYNNIYNRLESAKSFYPNFYDWYYLKVLPDIINKKRELITEVRNNQLVGISLVKYEEKKLCTLKVFEEFQNKGIGLKLFEKSFEKLETDKPFLTVSEEKYEEFKKVFDYYNFELTSVKLGLYRDDKLEYFFNEK